MFRTLWSFDNPLGGKFPIGGLTEGTNGDFFGITSQGGDAGYGTIFKISPTGGFQQIISFGDTNGSFPSGELLLGQDGSMYGTTSSGGLYNLGTIFRLTPEGSLTTLYSFNGNSGSSPTSKLLQSSDGGLWGTTESGGDLGLGTAFHLSANNTLTTLYSFNYTNGSSPEGGLVQGNDGFFYGTTRYGGAQGDFQNAFGTIFLVTSNGGFITLASLNRTNGAYPYGTLLHTAAGVFYGTTESGGANSRGVVFKFYITNAPVIFTQPRTQFPHVGAALNLNVEAFGQQPLVYQWSFNDAPILGGTNSTFLLSNVQLTNAGRYSVLVTNIYGSVTSAVARLAFIVESNRMPIDSEFGVPTIPMDDFLMVFTNGTFENYHPLDPTKMTVVLTHGWNSTPAEWPTSMAAAIHSNADRQPVNLVAWDWANAARSDCSPNKIARRTPGQGFALGHALLAKLGSNYSQPIHFIGHSMGTMVNAAAADYIHTNGFSWENTHVTLFDEAEVATGRTCTEIFVDFATASALGRFIGNPLSSTQPYYWPLPKQFTWADNYVSAFGLLHLEAANVILTNNFSSDASDYLSLLDRFSTFHSYPHQWYQETVQTYASPMGFQWSFELGGDFSQAPTLGETYMQANNSEWNLIPVDYEEGNNLLYERIRKYADFIHNTSLTIAGNTMTANGSVSGEMLTTGPSFVLQTTSIPNAPGPQNQRKQSDIGGANDPNLPAYLWIPIAIPSNAIWMTFDFMFSGNRADDSLIAAVHGTNIFSSELCLLQTNVTLNSGPIEISEWKGSQTELLLGITGGTSTNATISVSDIRFYSLVPPSLQIQIAETNAILKWPLAASSYSLEMADELAASAVWTITTNVPVIVDFENTVTNEISTNKRFYRLRQ